MKMDFSWITLGRWGSISLAFRQSHYHVASNARRSMLTKERRMNLEDPTSTVINLPNGLICLIGNIMMPLVKSHLDDLDVVVSGVILLMISSCPMLTYPLDDDDGICDDSFAWRPILLMLLGCRQLINLMMSLTCWWWPLSTLQQWWTQLDEDLHQF